MIPFFTIVVATYNRASQLDDCLASLSKLTPVPGRDHEVLVVDNNSSDETRLVVESWMPVFSGRLRYEFTGTQGKAHALNHAIGVVQGDFLAFTDDDARVDAGWLRAAAAGIADYPEAAAFGGRVVAEWPMPVPRWLAIEGPYRLHKCAISGHDLGPEPRFYRDDDPNMAMPVGVNMFLRRRAVEHHGGFRTDLWPGEDTEMVLRIWRAGEGVVYLPDAVVVHPVDPERLTKTHFRRWFHDKGRSMLRIDVEAGDGNGPGAPERADSTVTQPLATTVAGVPPYLIRMALVDTIRWMTALSNPVRRFHYECRLCGIWGQMCEARRLAARSRNGSAGSSV